MTALKHGFYYSIDLEAGSDIDVNECRLLSPDNTDKFHIYVMVSTSWLELGEEQRKLVYRGRNYVNVNSGGGESVGKWMGTMRVLLV